MQRQHLEQNRAGCEALRDTSPTLGCLGVAGSSTTSPRSEDARLGGVAKSPRSRPVREVGQGVDSGSAEHVVGGPAANCPVAVEGSTVQSQHGSRLADFQELRKDGVKRSLDLVSSVRFRHRDRSEAGKGTADVEARRHPTNEPYCPSCSVPNSCTTHRRIRPPTPTRGRNVWHRQESRVPNLGENQERIALRFGELREDGCLQRRRASTQTLAIVIGHSPRQLPTAQSARLGDGAKRLLAMACFSAARSTSDGYSTDSVSSSRLKTNTPITHCMQRRRGETRSRCRGRRKGAGETAHAPRTLVFGRPGVAECLRGRVAIEPRAPALEPAPDADIVVGAGKAADDIRQPRSASGEKLRIVAAEPPLPLRSLARYRRVPASGPGARTSRRVEESAPRTKHVGGRHGQDRHITLRCHRLPAYA